MYDTIIVGAGSAGCVLANRLSADPARKVLLVEAGGAPPVASDIPSDWPTMFNTHVDWGFHTEPQAGCRGRRIFWPRGKMLGGSGSLNAMIYLRGLPSDYDRWAAAGCPGWGWKDVLPVFRMSEDNPRLAGDPRHGRGGPLFVNDPEFVDPAEKLWIEAAVGAGFYHNTDFNGAEQEGVGLFQLTVRGGERWGTAKAYLRPARERPNLTVLTGATTTRVLVEASRAIGIEYLRNGQVEQAHAADVVLSSGAIGSCHLLLLSGIGPADELQAAGIAPLNDLPGVGKNLQDHLNIQISFAAHSDIGVGAMGESDLAASLAEWHGSRSGPRTSPWVAAGGQVASRLGIEPDLQLYGAISPHRDYARFLHSGSGVSLYATLQRPRSRGEVSLRNCDPLQAPIIDPRYFSSDPSGIDMATLVEGVRINRRIAASPPLAGLLAGELAPSDECRTDAEIAHHIRGHCTTLYHPTSTCRMGMDAMAVVDPTSFRVHGLKGLAIADASVFPDMISANLNATVIMIAERAAMALGRG